MLAPPDDFAVKPFTDRMAPRGQSFALWSRLLNKWLLAANGEALEDGPFPVSVRLRVLEDVRFGAGSLGASVLERNGEVAAQDNDDLFLFMNRGGRFEARHAGQEIILKPGEAYVSSCADRGTFAQPGGGRVLCLRTRRAAIQPLVRDLDDRLGSVIPRETEALRMLSTYMRVNLSEPLTSLPLRQLAARHVQDLLALALGATGDARDAAQERTLHTARLKAAKALARRNLADQLLSADTIAAQLGISPRTMQRLFEREGTTFTDFVIAERLAKAYTALGSDHGRSIAEIAMECGFGDISYFNRKFRARYRTRPSDVRHHDAAARANRRAKGD